MINNYGMIGPKPGQMLHAKGSVVSSNMGMASRSAQHNKPGRELVRGSINARGTS